MIGGMPKGRAAHPDFAPRIENRRAFHDYFIEAKLECGIMLMGSEVKSLRQGKAQIADSFAMIQAGELYLLNAHIDPYDKAGGVSHEPKRARKLLVHRREITRLAGATSAKGTTLVALAIYWKDGRAKVEIGVAKGKQQHDKRDTIRKKETDREIRRAMTHRR